MLSIVPPCACDIAALVIDLAHDVEAVGTNGHSTTYHVLLALRLFQLVRLLRLSQLSRLMRRWETAINLNYGHLLLARCALGFLFVAHLFACVLVLQTAFKCACPAFACLFTASVHSICLPSCCCLLTHCALT